MTSRGRLLSLGGVVGVMLGSGQVGMAQRSAPAPAPGPNWVERKVNLDGLNATAAEKAYAMARLEDIERIIVAVPEIANLPYPVRTDFRGFFASAPRANDILEYRYSVSVRANREFSPYCEIFSVKINPTREVGPSPFHEVDRPVLIEDLLGAPVPGARVVWRKLLPPPDPSFEVVSFVRDGESPSVQLTREEFRRWQIWDTDGPNGEKAARTKALLEKTPYERFMDEAPERKKLRDDLAVILKGLRTPQEIAAQIKELEDAERSAAEQLKASEAEDRQQYEAVRRNPLGDRLRASIAAMAPAERKRPAFVRMGSDLLYEFGTADSSNVTRAVQVNPDFWHAHRSRVEVRSMEVVFSGRCVKEPPPPPVHRALWELYQKIDWSAFTRMVNDRPAR